MIEQTNAFMAVALAGAVAAPALILGAARNSRWAACKLLAYADARDAFSARYRESHEAYADQFNIKAPVNPGSDLAERDLDLSLPAAEQSKTAKRRAALTVAILALPVWVGAVAKIFQEAGK